MLPQPGEVSYLLYEIAYADSLRSLSSDANYRRLLTLDLSWADIFTEIDRISNPEIRSHLRSIEQTYIFDFVQSHFYNLNLSASDEPEILHRAVNLLTLVEDPLNTGGNLQAFIDSHIEILRREKMLPRANNLLGGFREKSRAFRVIENINRVLFNSENIRGSFKVFDTASSHYPDLLLKTSRTGIPVSLSVIYLLIAQYAGLPVYGVNMPRHFMLKWQSRSEFFIDPFSGGVILENEDVEARIRSYRLSVRDNFTRPCDYRTVIKRMISNLLPMYEKNSAEEKAAFLRKLTRLLTG